MPHEGPRDDDEDAAPAVSSVPVPATETPRAHDWTVDPNEHGQVGVAPWSWWHGRERWGGGPLDKTK